MTHKRRFKRFSFLKHEEEQLFSKNETHVKRIKLKLNIFMKCVNKS